MNPSREMTIAMGKSFKTMGRRKRGIEGLGKPSGILPTTAPPPDRSKAFSSRGLLPILSFQRPPSPRFPGGTMPLRKRAPSGTSRSKW